MKETQTLNKKIEEFNRCMDWFYSDDFDLDAVEEKYKYSVQLAKEIKSDLAELENKIEILAEDFTK